MFTKKRRYMLGLIMSLTIMLSLSVQAADTRLMQVYSQGQYMDMFIEGIAVSEVPEVKISNRQVEVVDFGSLVDKGVTVRTTFLIDISKSVPEKIRGNVIEFLAEMIDGIKSNEEYRIVTFGETLSELSGFTSDRYVLAKATEDITFNELESKIYDALYKTIPNFLPEDGKAIYYRTIVLTDGVDDTNVGITKEELLLMLQNKTYPIDVIEVGDEEKTVENKELAALTRVSNGAYHTLSLVTDIGQLKDEIGMDDLKWVRILVPLELADGSTRQVDLDSPDETLVFDTKVNIYELDESENLDVKTQQVDEEMEITQENEENSEEIDDQETVSVEIVDIEEDDEAEVDEVDSKSSDLTKGQFFTLLFGVFIVILVGVVIAVFLFSRKRKSKKVSAEVSGKNNNEIISAGSDMTEVVGNNSSSSSDGGASIIVFRSESDSDKLWQLKCSKPIICGRRKECDLCIDETSVSRKQFKIYVADQHLMIENLSQSNVTVLNGKNVTAAMSINEGDTVKMGRVILNVDRIYRKGKSESLNKGTEFINI